MTSDRWAKLKEAFGAAIDSGGAGTDLLSDDPELRDELIDLLADHHSGATFLDNPPWGVFTLDGLDGADLDTPEAELLAPGQRVAGYVIDQLIGRGGMGEVYRATQDRPRRVVALKIIRAGLSSPRARLRLEAEADLLARLDHPGIARVIESGFLSLGEAADRQPPSPFFSMEFVEGVPINVFARDRGLDPAAIVELMRQVCEAVEHAHRRGIIHRDIKPDNILVDEKSHPRVLDFGVARAIERDLDVALTQPGLLPGTLAYMAPEQAAGDTDGVDTRSDVYALGVVLYELLTGRLPYATHGRSPIQVLRAIQEGNAPSPGSIVPELRGELDLIVTSAMEKDPQRRYGSAGALADDLGRFLRHEPLTVRSPSVGYVMSKFVRRHRLVSVAVAAATVALIAGLTVAAWQFKRAVDAQDLANERLAETRRVSAELVKDLSEKLWSFNSTTEVREYLAGEAMRRLEALLALHNDDPAILWDLSIACLKLGEASGHPGQPNAGRREDARTLIERSLAIRERVLAMRPQSREYRSGVAGIAWRLSALEEDQVRRAGLVRRAISLYEELWREDPSDPENTGALAYAHMVEGERLAGETAAFSGSFNRAESLFRELSERFPGDKRWSLGVGIVLSVHAQMVSRVDPAAGLSYFQRAKAVLQVELAKDPENYSTVRHIAKADLAQAAELARTGHPAEAHQLADGVVGSLRAWYQRDPTNSFNRLELVEGLLSAAACHLAGNGLPDRDRAAALAMEARALILHGGSPEDLPADELQLLARSERLLDQTMPKK